MNIEQIIQASPTNRITQRTKDVCAVLASSKGPIAIQDIYDQLDQKKLSINISTVHRIMERLIELGIVLRIPHKDRSLYEFASPFNPHHHHFTCKECGTIYEVHEEDVDSHYLDKKNIKNIGIIISHSVDYIGICMTCSKKDKFKL